MSQQESFYSDSQLNANITVGKQMSNKDGLMVAVARLDLYRAVSNPAYLCHSSDDPILTAFQLGHALRQWAYVTSEFRAAYLELASETRKFCVDLIASCRSSEEVELILRRRAGCSYPGEVMFPRLMLAMDYNQKEFVAHPNTQQVLEDAWHGDWHTWRSRADILKTLTVIPRICMLPIITIMCLFVPTHRLVRRWQLPINKLLSSVASYIVFLIIVFLESNLSKIEQKRGPPNSGLEPILVVYVVAFVWRSIRMYIIQGPRRFFTVLSNWYDCIWQLLFCITFLCWIAAYLDVKNKGERDLERKYWHYLDPTLIAEGFFTAAAIMAFARILLLCQLNYHLGPLQVSLGKMVKDIAKFVVIYFLLILAFAAGLCRFYEYYDGMVQEDKATGNTVTQVSSFVSFEKTLKTLFWALFCMSPVESADVVIENLPGPTEDTTVLNHHRFTEAVGHVAFALFEVVSVIIILNMLIATICSTFQKVTDNVDVEWTFGRTAEVEGEDEGEKKFPIVMAQLIQRYYRSMEKQQQQESGDRTELQTLRQENESLRASLREAGIPK
ncbi:short transient receptor potential channel 5 [Anabrus simplex]|uniref:short transient receptor potential channel 5 n=1 Tax=Anabrus simplex TaxID=316456 RepID=UPI0035A3CEB7